MAYALVQSTNNGTGATPISVVYGSTPVNGNLMLASVYMTTGTTAPTVSDTNGNWTLLNSSAVASTRSVFLFGKIATTSQPTSISVAGSGTLFVNLYEFSGNQASITGIVDASATSDSGGTTGNNESGLTNSVTTTNAADLLFAVNILSSGSGGFSWTGANLLQQNNGTTSNRLTDGYQIETATGTYNPFASWTTARNWALITTALNPAATGTLSVSVSDSTTTSESIKAEANNFIAVSDSSSTSEGINLTVVSLESVSDTTSTSESINLLSVENVNVSDTATTSENVVALIPSLPLAVSDSSATSENVAIAIPSAGDLLANVSDSTTASESIKVEENKFISVSDSSTTSESVVAFVPTYPLAVSDSTTLSENVSPVIPTLSVNKSDSSTTSENISVQISQTPQINKSDTVTTSESVTLNRYYPINKSETVHITESVSVLPYTFPRDVSMAIVKSGTITVSVARQANPTFKIQTGEL